MFIGLTLLYCTRGHQTIGKSHPKFFQLYNNIIAYSGNAFNSYHEIAIGYFTDTKNLRVVNIYQNCKEKFHITFYPDAHTSFIM